ncbi:hypothetical protein [Lundtoftevirus Lu221]|uniref:Uncharacterized protein n=1 Tax=phage PKM.Lu.22.1 TaxID=3049197 RepID=A0AAF0KYG9_9CAUD|nr:hypothetical protein [phage PKM.Lu.22.1]
MRFVNYATYPVVAFGKLLRGQVFEHQGEMLMCTDKIIPDGSDTIYNAINLQDGSHRSIYELQMVELREDMVMVSDTHLSKE